MMGNKLENHIVVYIYITVNDGYYI